MAFIQSLKRSFSSDRHSLYLQYFSTDKVSDKEDRVQIEELCKKVRRIQAHLKWYVYSRYFFFLLLYASVALPFLAEFPVLAQYGILVVQLAGFAGASLLGLIVLVLTKMITIHKGDLDITVSHIISLYAKNDVLPDFKHPRIP